MSYVSPGIPRTTFARRVFLWPHCSTACVVRVESCRTLAPDTETWPWPVRQGHTRVSSPSRGALRCRRTPSATSRLYTVNQKQRATVIDNKLSRGETIRFPDMELGHWIVGSMGHLGRLSRPGHRVIILTRCETRPQFFQFSKKAQDKDIKIYIFVKIRPTVIEILIFNKMIFKILLSRSVQTPNSDKNWQTSCPMQTFVCNMSRHLEFIIEQDRRVNWVSAGRWIPGSLGHTMWPSSISAAARCISTVAPMIRHDI